MKKRITVSLLTVILLFSCSIFPALAVASAENDYINHSYTNDYASEGIDAHAATTNKAIIIVPGVLGSKLYRKDTWEQVWPGSNNILYLNENGTAASSNVVASPYPDYGTQDTYATLYSSLESAFGQQFDIIFFNYDWRLSNEDSALKLQTIASQYNQVVFVAHSMGGLVVSKYLTLSTANRSRTAGLITLGTPFAGAAKCINVMETGDLIKYAGIYLYTNTVKEICKNSNAAYQLLPNAYYYSKTSAYPVSVNGVSYTSILPLQNTTWGKTSSGIAKTQFETATYFHSYLLNGNGEHVKNWSDVNCYTIAGSGVDTISTVNLTSNYNVSGLTYSNSGDGTVLTKSAGFGAPNVSCTNVEHAALVSNSNVIAKVKAQITVMTGVSQASALTFDATDSSELFSPTEITVNTRGWIEGTDNQRINVYANSDAELFVNGVAIDESKEALYSGDGNRIGTVWPLGDTGRKMYALYNGNYEIVSNGDVKIEYMDSGYFNKVAEYTTDNVLATFSISDYSLMEINCAAVNLMRSSETIEIQPSHIYTVAELDQLNED